MTVNISSERVIDELKDWRKTTTEGAPDSVTSLHHEVFTQAIKGVELRAALLTIINDPSNTLVSMAARIVEAVR